ncbi:MAG: ATP-binding protein [Thermodesulfobacteriota bacterium]
MGSPVDKEISCRITRTLLMYVRENNHGSLGTLLDGLELNEAYLLDTDNWVSHAFLQTLYGRMIALLGDENAVYNMTLASGRFQSLGLLDRIARLLGNPRFIYASAPKYNRMLKLNGDVHIHDLGSSWVVLEDRYHDSAQKTRLDCDYTRGVLTGIPTLFDMPVAHVEEIACQVAPEVYGRRIWPDNPPYGSRGCLYRVRWEPRVRPSLWRRLFRRSEVYHRAIEDLMEANRKIQDKYDEVQKLATDLETANRRLLESKRQLETYTAELSASERRYRLLAENATDIIWTLSLETLRFTYISPSVLRCRGFTPDEAMALSLEETLSPASMEEVARILEEELARDTGDGVDPNRSRTLEVQQTCKDGTVVWAEATVTFIRDDSGRPTAILGVTRDIRERKEAEQLYQAKVAAEASSRVKSEFLSIMSHELRTPLNHIIGFTDLVLDQQCGELNQTQKDYLKDVLGSSRHLLDLVNEVLDLSKIEAGRLVLSHSDIDLRALLEHALNVIRETAESQHIGLSLSVEGVPEFIRADQLRLTEILYNLLSNAAKFTPGGGSIRLSARMAAGEPGGASPSVEGSPREVLISVADTGIGIKKQDMERIFEPFSQVDNPLTRKFRGTGLGLSLTRQLVHMHGGRIWVDSPGEGMGSTFHFTLPLRA